MAKFGVEIEFVTTRFAANGSVQTRGPMIAAEMRAAGLEVDWMGYTHRTTAAWKLVYDSSVMNGFELVSPPIEMDRAEAELAKAVAALDAVSATVNQQCGLHVHHDASSMNAQQVANLISLYGTHEEYIHGALAPSRRNSRWAKPVRSMIEAIGVKRWNAMTDLAAVFNNDRYHAINLQSYFRHGTVEFRAHQGTTNYTKILNWVKLTSALVEKSKATTRRTTYRVATAKRSHYYIGVMAGTAVANYIRDRREAFNV